MGQVEAQPVPPKHDCSGILVDTDVGWLYPDDGFALGILLMKVLNKECSVKLINITNGMAKSSDKVSSRDLVTSFVSDLKLTIPVVEEDSESVATHLRDETTTTVVALGPFMTINSALIKNQSAGLSDDYLKNKHLVFQGAIPSYNNNELRANMVWFEAFRSVVSKPWKSITLFPTAGRALNARDLLVPFSPQLNLKLGKTFNLFCTTIQNHPQPESRCLDDTMVIFSLFYYEEFLKFWKTEVCTQVYGQSPYQVNFGSSVVIQASLNTNFLKEYLKSLQQVLFTLS